MECRSVWSGMRSSVAKLVGWTRLPLDVSPSEVPIEGFIAEDNDDSRLLGISIFLSFSESTMAVR